MRIVAEIQMKHCSHDEKKRDSNGDLKTTPRKVVWITAESIIEVDILKDMLEGFSYRGNGVFFKSKEL
jgi:hypothetical protein